MAQIIDGKLISSAFKDKIAEAISSLKAEQDVTPGLAVVLVGDDPASDVYVRSKGVATKKAGMNSYEHRLPADTSEKDMLDLIHKLNQDEAVDGILVQSPVPDQINYQAVVDAIDPAKDVDGFHPINAGNLLIGANCFVACTPLGCSILLKHTLGDLTGKNAIVLGRSTIVGKPMAMLLLQQHCTVTIAHSRTQNLAQQCAQADIVVAAVGRPEMVKKDWIKPGATVIDVGINRIGTTESGKAKLVGDVAYDEVSEVAGAITPVPGGVGPMTIACLMFNALKAACDRRGLPVPDVFGDFL
ncbi:MAG: bifunctional methylenetetrahydrofolate dehydrogenase/methenyltetrahydrofolate cyclohydrolase FolD [Gammaproteobacteria bacterium]|nr:MAG: bifunctional methylenetetrahydrofolate dehydrogenase/methenyltetrahydrofolate cyclohydrolase FolD [Gammaproteobacteria bacterium]